MCISKKYAGLFFIVFVFLLASFVKKNSANSSAANEKKETAHFYSADHPYIQYTGRIDFSNPKLPKFRMPGIYVTAKFKGTFCEVIINDEVLYGNSHNYISIIIDNGKPVRIQTTGKSNTIQVAKNLSNNEHNITICKDTEAGIGYLELVGLKCTQLLRPAPKPLRKIEFIGNSITCGMASDVSVIPCGARQWYDQHNAYMSYGPTTARILNAQWHLSAISGVGLIHSCCNISFNMPQVFDNLNLHIDSTKWNFKNYQPDVVSIALGQNDGIQDSTKFCNAYIQFIKRIRVYYPKATIVCLNSPMAGEPHSSVLKKYISAVVTEANKKNDRKVYSYFFSQRYYKGCDSHPSLSEHQQMAAELSQFIKKTMKW